MKLSSDLQTKKNPDSAKEHSQQAGFFFVALEVTKKSRRKAQTSGHIRKTRGALGENHQMLPKAASSVSRSRYDFVPFASSFQKVILYYKNTV